MPMTNVLLITSDQQHWNTLGRNNPELRTPALDKLAAQGTTFTRAYCPNPTCTPTRASMITGKYPSQHGAWSLGTKLPESEPTIGQVFGDAGYRSALIGKAHFQPLRSTAEYPSLEAYPILQDLDFWRDFHGPFYGFDHVELARNHTDEAHVGQHYALWMEDNGLRSWRDYFLQPTGHVRAQRRKWLIPERYHYNAWIAERSNALISQYQRQEQPFFLWASFFDPHPKYMAPEPWDTMYDPDAITVPGPTPDEHAANPPHLQMTQQADPDFSPWREVNGSGCHGFHSHLCDRAELAKDIACYYGMISCMDHYIGRIVDHLDDMGLAENTLVVFTSDHGHYFGQHGLIAKGAFHYDDGIRVPMIARWPGRIPSDRVCDSLQSLVDYAPTLLDCCGLEVPAAMTGRSQRQIWDGDAAGAREHVIVENRHQPTKLHLKTYIDERYKLTLYYGRDYGELFDLGQDPGEVQNLWSDAALRAQLTEAFLRAEMEKEEPLSEDSARLPHKSAAMNVKSANLGDWRIHFDARPERCQLYNLTADPGCAINLWDAPEYVQKRAEMTRALLFSRWGLEPLWMPRVAAA